MGGASDQIFVFKALTSSIGLLASGLLMQGLSSAIGLFASDLLLQGFHFREWKPFGDYLLIQGFELTAWRLRVRAYFARL